MTGPENLPAETKSLDPQVTGIVPLDSLDHYDVESLNPPAAPYKPEPLFNKKVMFLWALGAAAVWFTIKFVTPIAIESAKTAIVESVNESQPGTTVTITRNGRVITIDRSPTKLPAPPPVPAPAAGGAAATPEAAPVDSRPAASGAAEKKDAARK